MDIKYVHKKRKVKSLFNENSKDPIVYATKTVLY